MVMVRLPEMNSPALPASTLPCPAEKHPRQTWRGSALLASCWSRMARTLLAVVLLWVMAGWALQWW